MPNSDPAENEIQLTGNLYDYPKYYDVIFGADWAREFRFLKWCFENLTELEVQTLLEPACGTGRLIVQLAKAGFTVAGLDLCQAAVDYCNKRFKRSNLPQTAFTADMSDFSLADLNLSAPVQAAFNPINSIRHLMTESKMQSHWQCMSQAIQPGGLYIVGLHLIPQSGQECEDESWVACRGALEVQTDLQTVDLDLDARVERCAMTYRVRKNDKRFSIQGELVFRTYTLDQFIESFESSEKWELMATYDFTYQTDQQLTLNQDSEDVMFVLKRK